VANGLHNLAALYCDQQRYSESEELHEQALAIRLEVAGSEHPDVAESYYGLARVHMGQGRSEKARRLCGQALTIQEKVFGHDHPVVATSLAVLSDAYRTLGEYSDAAMQAKRAFGIRHKSFTDNALTLSEKDALLYSQHLRHSVDAYLSCYFDLPTPGNAAVREAADIVLSTKGCVSDETFERQRTVVIEKDAATQSLARSLRQIKFHLSRLFVEGPGEDAADYRREMDSLGKLVEELEADFSRHSACFRELKDIKRISAQRVASVLPANSVLLEFVRYDYIHAGAEGVTPRYLAVAVLPGEEPAIVDLGDASEVDDLVGKYRRHMTRVAGLSEIPGTVQRDYEMIAKRLHARVWQPIEDYAVGRDLVFIAADGALNAVSFAALKDADNRYLVEGAIIHYLSSGRDLIRLGKRQVPAVGLLAFADPDYNASLASQWLAANSTGPGTSVMGSDVTRSVRSGCEELKDRVVPPLPGTRTEVETIVRRWKESITEPALAYFGTDASEYRFKTAASGSRVIHLATHGFFLGHERQENQWLEAPNRDIGFAGENPLLLSGLYFAGANRRSQVTGDGDVEDGILTAYEISALNLEGTELVVLSACETGLGEILEGEGVYGLRRAFQMAGARTVVSALWPVSDRLTAELMSEMYSAKGESLPSAMRRIQLQRLDELRSRGETEHPYSWAAFIAVGDWR
jgi:CHAT domain-containing protein